MGCLKGVAGPDALNLVKINVSLTGTCFQHSVIFSSGSVVETVSGFQKYKDAMRRKLLCELAPAIASLYGPIGARLAHPDAPYGRAQH